MSQLDEMESAVIAVMDKIAARGAAEKMEKR